MKLILLACLSFSVRGSDDQSLMQHGVGVASQSSAQLGARLIKQELAEMPYPGKMRQIAIDALMKTVEESDQIDTKTVELLTEMKNLLKTITDGFGGEKTADDVAHQKTINDGSNCNTDGTQQDTAAEANYTNQVGDHRDCRINVHAPATEKKTSDCNIVESDMASYSPLEFCTAINALSVSIDGAFNNGDHDSPIDVAELQELIEKISDGKAHFGPTGDGVLASFTTKKGACEGSQNDWTTAKESCDTFQTKTESSYCVWRAERQSMCATRVACHAAATAAYTTELLTVNANGLSRTNTAIIIELTICIIDHMIADDIGDQTVVNCRATLMTPEKQTDRNASYQTSVIAYPAQEHCDLDAVIQVVGVDFQAWAYADIPCRDDTCPVLPPVLDPSGCGSE